MSIHCSQLITRAKRSLLFSRHGACLATLILSCVAGSSSLRGQESESTPPSLQPADVYQRVGVVRAELELIRLEMGEPLNETVHFSISDAAPREVFFQAVSLFRKSNRLCYEHTRTETAEPGRPFGQVRPEHVYDVVEAALAQISRVKEKLGVLETVRSPARDASITPTDVFRSIVQANKQLNQLLERQYASSDVYEQVTHAIGYASQLLASFPGATRIPPEPEFERRKRPVDVYGRLFECLELVGSIAEQSDVQIAHLTRLEGDTAPIAPGDVYGLATLMVSELAYIHSRMVGAAQPVPPYYPGRKLPSHVYQRVGILEAQLVELEKRVRAAPGWLGDTEPR